MGLRMPKVAKVLCIHCEKKMDAGASFCPHCEHPTHWATHDERVAWELASYKKMRTVPLEPGRPEATPIRRVSTTRVSLEPTRQPAHATTLARSEPPRPRPEPPRPRPEAPRPRPEAARPRPEA